MVEAPHLGRLMEKIQGPGRPAPERLTYPALDPADAAVPAADPALATSK